MENHCIFIQFKNKRVTEFCRLSDATLMIVLILYFNLLNLSWIIKCLFVYDYGAYMRPTKAQVVRKYVVLAMTKLQTNVICLAALRNRACVIRIINRRTQGAFFRVRTQISFVASLSKETVSCVLWVFVNNKYPDQPINAGILKECFVFMDIFCVMQCFVSAKRRFLSNYNVCSEL